LYALIEALALPKSPPCRRRKNRDKDGAPCLGLLRRTTRSWRRLCVAGPGTVSGKTLTVLGVGSVVIQADQAGNASFSAAPPVQHMLIVNKATTSTALAVSAAVVKVNTNVTFTAAVSSPGLPATDRNDYVFRWRDAVCAGSRERIGSGYLQHDFVGAGGALDYGSVFG
jgi:hypothetical protein